MVEWQTSQLPVVWMWPAGLPGAVLPLWQVVQEPVTLAWSMTAGVQPRVVWQDSQLVPAWMWPAGLPGAVEPLWQLAQEEVSVA